VTWAVLTILVTWGVLYLFFVKWRAGYRENVAYAKASLAPAVDPLAKIVPPNTVPATWAETVAETHAAFDRLAGSGVVDKDQIQALQAHLSARVARTRPETAARELAEIWADMLAGAGPAIGSAHPALLKLAMPVNPLAYMKPDDVDAATWRDALAETRALLVAATASGALDGAQQESLARDISLRLSQTQPDTAVFEVARIWDYLAAHAPDVTSTMHRPAFLPPPPTAATAGSR
jgi:hypothetical protein